MNATHSELIANIKRLTVLVKGVDYSSALLKAAEEGDYTAIHAKADHDEEHGHPDAPYSRLASKWLRGLPEGASEHPEFAQAAAAYVRSPGRFLHPNVAYHALDASTKYRDQPMPTSIHDDNALRAFDASLAHHRHPLSEYVGNVYLPPDYRPNLRSTLAHLVTPAEFRHREPVVAETEYYNSHQGYVGMGGTTPEGVHFRAHDLQDDLHVPVSDVEHDASHWLKQRENQS